MAAAAERDALQRPFAVLQGEVVADNVVKLAEVELIEPALKSRLPGTASHCGCDRR
jgi:hypothetical protein